MNHERSVPEKNPAFPDLEQTLTHRSRLPNQGKYKIRFQLALQQLRDTMSEELLIKRLHISGLTSAISTDDLSRRLATFGTIVALDGFGKRDALGQPRPYAFATLHTTKGKLLKCMNSLNGSIWKGAKLRIGEARPDYHER